MISPAYSIKIGGQAGQGIKTSGISLAKVASRSGYFAYNYVEYPSLIKGGHNVIQTTFSAQEVYSQIRDVHFLVALDQNTINLHKDELIPGAGVIVEDGSKIDLSSLSNGQKIFSVPFRQIASDLGAGEIVSNTITLGALIYLLGGDLRHLHDLVQEEFTHTHPEFVKTNQEAASAGYEYAKSHYPDGYAPLLQPIDTETQKILVNGNESVGMAAIAAGMQFISMYPMSPVSNLLHFLSEHQKEYGYVVKQVEDEISAINMAIGASLAGARSMTSTSGGGFCLMTEGIGLSGMTETPLVIVLGMRAGPSTGLPTWSEQGDLAFALHSGHGEFPRFVLAAGDAKEAFYLAMVAFNLSEKYQTPTVLLIDKNICDHEQTFIPFDYSSYKVDRGQLIASLDENYQRYQLTQTGVSPRTLPGVGNYFVVNSDEHNTSGLDTELISDRNDQMHKRLSKSVTCRQNDMPKPILIGPESADITIVSWGSTKGPILQSLRNHPNVNYLHITWMDPFPDTEVLRILSNARYVLDIETNSTGQLANLIREKTGIDILDKFLKNDGRPFYPEEITERINSILTKK